MSTASHVNHVLPLAVRGQPPIWALAQGFDKTLTVMIAGMATWAASMVALSILL
jgi:hypothetical protein